MFNIRTPVAGIDAKGQNKTRNVSVEFLPFLYISGMKLSAASTTVMAIAPGHCRDQSNSFDIIVPPIGSEIGAVVNPFAQSPYAANGGQVFAAPLFVDPTQVGAGGIDQGTLAASTAYAVYVIASSRNKKPVAGLLSLTSNVAPLLPLGYDSWRLLGFSTTDGASHFIAANILNEQNANSFYLSPAAAILTGGNATTFTAMNFSTNMPANPNSIAYMNVVFTGAAAGDTVQFRPTGSTATANLTTITCQVAGVPIALTVPVVVGINTTAEVDYKVTSASDTVSVTLAGYSTTTT